MKTIIIQYPTDSELYDLIESTKKIESSSGASLCKRALYNYCKKILRENGITKGK